MFDTVTPPISVPGQNEPEGVGGWLLLLCVGLTIGNPLLTLYNVVTGIWQTIGLATQIHNWGIYLYIDSALSLAIAVISFIAGLRLWREVPSADRLAMVALAAIGFYHLLCFPLLALMNFPAPVYDAMQKALVSGTARPLLGACIWMLYLARSRRVANTYRRPQEGVPVGA